MDFKDTHIQDDMDRIDNWITGLQWFLLLVAGGICLLVSGCGGNSEGMDEPRSTIQPVNCASNPQACK